MERKEAQGGEETPISGLIRGELVGMGQSPPGCKVATAFSRIALGEGSECLFSPVWEEWGDKAIMGPHYLVLLSLLEGLWGAQACWRELGLS